ncbi:MAG: glycolate oxidase subunit GlcF [Tistlia sp.]|uniref:glycolate oxidase subunit GlcF n=1 Tax=Tistlia sp. TaxID=3057121 RepID=UPI0034A13D5F
MQTDFTLAQLADPEIAEANDILRSCVHCGFCTATCPTYVLLGDELDSPRGRIYLIKDMLEKERAPSVRTVTHIDRCLSCLSCMTTCPASVHYMHLLDQARVRIEEQYERPPADRLLRSLLAWLLPRPRAFRLALIGAWFARPFAGLAGGLLGGRLQAMLRLAPASLPAPSAVDRPQVFAAEGPRRLRVALLAGCAQQVLAPEINEATIRLLTRHGVEVVIARGAGCCGALTHHMGKEAPALASARANVEAWTRELEGEGLDAVVVNASGCGTTVKEYGHMLRLDEAWAGRAAAISALTRDVTELLDELGSLDYRRVTGQAIAYHSACSMQHGQQIRRQPKALLQAAGFVVKEPLEGHLCCGSAGVYNLLQPALAGALRDRKVANIERTGAPAVATGNIGCITQIAGGTGLPVVHTVGLLDWATGGPLPKPLQDHPAFAEPPRAT